LRKVLYFSKFDRVAVVIISLDHLAIHTVFHCLLLYPRIFLVCVMNLSTLHIDLFFDKDEVD